MNRRKFLENLGFLTAGALVATVLPKEEFIINEIAEVPPDLDLPKYMKHYPLYEGSSILEVNGSDGSFTYDIPNSDPDLCISKSLTKLQNFELEGGMKLSDFLTIERI